MDEPNKPLPTSEKGEKKGEDKKEVESMTNAGTR